jgi:hypothetical protein
MAARTWFRKDNTDGLSDTARSILNTAVRNMYPPGSEHT